MKTWFYKLLFTNPQRKAISLALAVIIWCVVNHSLITTKTLTGVPLRVTNLSAGKTIEGVHKNGLLAHKVSLIVVGSETVLNELSPNDVELVIDARECEDNVPLLLTKKHLVSLNPQIDLQSAVRRIIPPPVTLRIDSVRTNLVPLNTSLPVTLFHPAARASTKVLAESSHTLDIPLFVKGVSASFLNIVKDRLQICVVAPEEKSSGPLEWSVQFINPKELEEKFVAAFMANSSEEQLLGMEHTFREEYVRSRFRSYMNNFVLYVAEEQPLSLSMHLEDGSFHLQAASSSN